MLSDYSDGHIYLYIKDPISQYFTHGTPLTLGEKIPCKLVPIKGNVLTGVNDPIIIDVYKSIKTPDNNWEKKHPASFFHKSGLSKSQKNFDIMKYDRLGVLTAELKKLIFTDVEVFIELNSKKNLDTYGY